MSGTSCDGIDAVAVALRDAPAETLAALAPEHALEVSLAAHVHLDYEPAFRRRLLEVGQARAPELARLHVALGERFAEAAAAALQGAGWSVASLAAVACPGHTAVHLPPVPGDAGATLALGDGDVLAERLGCPALTEMRARDRAAGGQGAPLVPLADALLLRRPGRVRAALNLGGIANLTIVPASGPPLAFDTGPGNMLLDGALERATGGAMACDEGGALGLDGRVEPRWLAAALAADDFLGQRPPRSTGRERYGAAWLDRHWPVLGGLALPDLAASLAAYSVACVVDALERHVRQRPDELIVSGGGAFNRCLMQGLAQRLHPLPVRDSQEALGVPVLAREALAFAVLADRTLAGAAGNVPGVTGARAAVRLGKLSYGPLAG